VLAITKLTLLSLEKPIFSTIFENSPMFNKFKKLNRSRQNKALDSIYKYA